jgi:hypothetical protein
MRKRLPEDADVRELFVWYHVDERNAEALRAGVEAVQRSLEQRFEGLRARLLVRREVERQTWMETFARSPRIAGGVAGVDAATEAAIAAAALPLRPLLASDRHVESFETVRSAEER